MKKKEKPKVHKPVIIDYPEDPVIRKRLLEVVFLPVTSTEEFKRSVEIAREAIWGKNRKKKP